MFGKKTEPKTINLTNDGFRRWLRAHRPESLAWFLSLDEMVQEQLALIGDDYSADLIDRLVAELIAPGMASNIQAAERGDSDADAALSASLIEQMAAQMIAKQGPQYQPRSNGFGGSGGSKPPVVKTGDPEYSGAVSSVSAMLGRIPDEVET